MLPRSFYFVRHGETDWNARGVLQGHTDIPLNERGRAQARAAVALIASLNIDLIVSSPLSRARETADIINSDLKKRIMNDEGLRERHFGQLEGKGGEEAETMKAQWRLQNPHIEPEENGYHCPPGAESYADFRGRTLSRIAHHLDAAPGDNVLFVCHGGLYRVLSRCLTGEAGSSPNVQPFHFEKSGEIWRINPLKAQ